MNHPFSSIKIFLKCVLSKLHYCCVPCLYNLCYYKINLSLTIVFTFHSVLGLTVYTNVYSGWRIWYWGWTSLPSSQQNQRNQERQQMHSVHFLDTFSDYQLFIRPSSYSPFRGVVSGGYGGSAPSLDQWILRFLGSFQAPTVVEPPPGIKKRIKPPS